MSIAVSVEPRTRTKRPTAAAVVHIKDLAPLTTKIAVGLRGTTVATIARTKALAAAPKAIRSTESGDLCVNGAGNEYRER
jgi:hypothetical protein